MEFLTIHRERAGVILNFHQDIDAGITNQLTRQIDQELPDQYDFVLIDLSDIRFLDSAAVNLLINVIKSAREIGANHGIAGAEFQPKSVLQMIGVDNITGFYTDRPAALTALTAMSSKVSK